MVSINQDATVTIINYTSESDDRIFFLMTE